jgi:hypothetical protein
MNRKQFLGMLIGLPFIGKMIGKEKELSAPSEMNLNGNGWRYALPRHGVSSSEAVDRICGGVYKDQFQEVVQYVKTGENSGYQWLRYPTTKREDGSYIYGEMAGKLTKVWAH